MLKFHRDGNYEQIEIRDEDGDSARIDLRNTGPEAGGIYIKAGVYLTKDETRELGQRLIARADTGSFALESDGPKLVDGFYKAALSKSNLTTVVHILKGSVYIPGNEIAYRLEEMIRDGWVFGDKVL